MKKNKKSIIVLTLLLMVGITSGYVASTYAKYTGKIDGDGTAVVAKWEFVNDNSITDFDINPTGTIDTTTLSSGKIAPGTSGSFDILVVNTNSEVGVEYTIKVGTISAEARESGKTATVPSNLKFYQTRTGAGTEEDPYIFTDAITSDGITDELAAKDATGATVTIYWQWAYETGTVTDNVAEGDSDDNTAGENASTLTIPVSISGVQVKPSNTKIGE